MSTPRVTTPRRRVLASVASGLGVTVAGCLGDDDAEDVGDGGTDIVEDGEGHPAWSTTPMEDVQTGERVVLGEFERPVLMKSFAIWCATCDAQEERVADLLATRDDVDVVSMNIDANESGGAVAAHAAAHGYEWHYVVPPDAVIESLREQFDRRFVTSPPSVPKALVCPDGGVRRLENGIMEADELSAEFDRGC